MHRVRAVLVLALAALAALPAIASAAYRDAVLADDPSGYWRLEETTGPLGANEVAGGSRASFFQHPLLDEDGAFAGSRAATAGFRSLLDFGPPIDAGDDATYDFWFKAPDLIGPQTSFEGLLEVPGDWGIWIVSGALVGGCQQNTWVQGPRVADGAWHHVAARFSDGAFELFLDGVELGEQACSYDQVHDRLIGGWGGGQVFVKPLPRTIDEVAMYDNALSDAAIATHAGARTTADEAPHPPRAPQTGGPYTQAVLADQPWSYYRLEDRPWSQDGTMSTRVEDSSGNARHSSMQLGGMDRAPGPITTEQRNVSMRPRGHLFDVPAPATPDASIEAWVKLVTTGNHNWLLQGGRADMYFSGVELGVLPMGQVTLNDNKWSDRAWHHIVVTKNAAAGEARIYRDGELLRVMPEADASPWFTDARATIGGGGDPGSLCIDEVALYDKVLSAASVAAHFAAAGSDSATGGCGGTPDVRAGFRPPPPANTQPPSIRGTAQAGRMIWCDPGEWSGNPTQFRYRWYRDGVDLGFEEWALRLDASADGREHTCRVVATGSGGDSAEAESAPVVPSGRPSAPGTPRVVAGSDPRAIVQLEWDPSPATPVPAEWYVVERLRAGEWVRVARLAGTSVGINSELEGRLRYRVRAEAAGALSEPSGESAEVLVDRTAPRPARLESTSAPAWTSPAGEDWYRDSFTGTWSHDGDPDLADGTPGSGVDPASVPGPVSLTTTGANEVVARLRDLAGNQADTVRVVRVDADPPQLTLTCPSEAHVGAIANATATVSDPGGSGVAGSVPNDVAIDTGAVGTETVTLTATDNVGHETTRSCDVPVRHRRPTAPQVVAGANPGRGEVTLGWSRYPGSPLPAAYVLEARDADDAGWTEVYRGQGETYAFPAGSPLAQGTWTFRVRADDPSYTTEASPESERVVADRTGPSGFTAAADRAPERDATGTANDWWADSVTVSFTGGSDPALPDGSPGTGLDPSSVAAVTLSSQGIQTASATPRDQAGNAGSAVSLTVRVDRSLPTAALTCPASPVVQDSAATASWTASDTGSGLSGPASGTVALDTSTIGTRTASSPAITDRVGHTAATVSCTYRVIYDWTGFLDPVQNPSTVNDIDAGDIAPMIFSLNGDRGLGVISGTATVSSGCGGRKEDVAWTLPATWTTLQYLPQYDVYVWPFRTQASWRGTCRTLTITLADGTTHSATFRFQ